MQVLKRAISPALFGLASVTLLAWAYTVWMALDMRTLGDQALAPQVQSWSPTDLAWLFMMWVVMMVAMMLPSAMPMIAVFGASVRRHAQAQQVPWRTLLFAFGYLAAWSAFSLLVTILQWRLHEAALLTLAMTSASGVLAGVLLIVAGAFQWTRLKHACLQKCRSPLGFFMSEWRPGNGGAFVMGCRHGLFCVGCCWALMLLLFVSGVMNLLWIAALSLLVLLEKVVPSGALFARVTGVLLIVAGVVMLLRT